MSAVCDSIDKIYTLSKVLTCNEIKLSAWNRHDNHELLALFVENGDFVFCRFTDEEPAIKQVPWFSDVEHTPVSMCFNPSGTFLLVLSRYGHIYVVPAMALFDGAASRGEEGFDASDITLHSYPYPAKSKQGKSRATKSPNASLGARSSHSSSSGSTSGEGPRGGRSPCGGSVGSAAATDARTSKNLVKLKDMGAAKANAEATAIAWWQSGHSAKQTAVLATKSGEIIFVDLFTGTKIGDASVGGHVVDLCVCQDSGFDSAFLLITLENKVQYKLTLERKEMNFSWPTREYPFDEGDNSDNSSSGSGGGGGNGKGNYLPAARSRLQGLKQLSVEKIANLKQKLAESRSKATAKEDNSEDGNHKALNPEPDYVWGRVNDVILSPQHFLGQFVLAGYHPPTQFLSVHTLSLDRILSCTYKMPADVEEVVLCDSVIFAVSTNRCVLQVISCNVSQKSNFNWEFNSDYLLGKWDVGGDANASEGTARLKPDLIPESHMRGSGERIIGVYRRNGREEPWDLAEEYNLERRRRAELGEGTIVENGVVVTSRGVYVLERRSSVARIALDWILNANEPEKVEKICGIFRLNLGSLLELAGDVRLASSDLARAIALYRVSECGLLKIAVKLSAGGHCDQLLKYSVPLMSDSSFSDMSATERIHLSNLVLMAYTQQILCKDHSSSLTTKFLDFLESNSYYDGILGVSVTGQSFLFRCLHKLMIRKGLVLDGYNVLVKLARRFLENKSLEWTIDKDDFWTCLTESCVIEAMICRGGSGSGGSSSVSAYADYVAQNVDSIGSRHLERLLVLADPTSPYVRSIARTSKLLDDSFADSDESESAFPFQKLVELFLLALLVKMSKVRDDDGGYDRELLLPSRDKAAKSAEESAPCEEDASDAGDAVNEHIWPIRKGIKDNEVLRRKRECVLSCGFGHSALVRNGAVYTWGQTAKGCLGHGPTMSKYAAPQAIAWLGALKLEVTMVACGKQHTVALTNNGLYAWGCSAYGQLGLGEVRESPHPRLVTSVANESVISVKCGQYHTVALTSRGSVFAWGWGVHGQLGLGTIEDERFPRLVHTLNELVIVDVAAGHGHSLVLSDKGHVYAFGSGFYGQLGTGNVAKSSVPVLVKGINGRVVCIATGYFHNLAVTESNAVYTWGISPLSLRRRRQRLLESERNSASSPAAEAADATTDEETPTTREEVVADAVAAMEKADAHLSPSVVDTRDVHGRIVQVCCGCHDSVLVTDSGSLYSWGRSVSQVGNVSQKEILKPTLFTFNEMKVDAVACGCDFTAVQDKQSGKVYAWGNNSVGQLGFPAEESAANGKLIMLKSYKRTIRLPLSSNVSFLSPREVPDIPSSSFTYQTLNQHSSVDSFSLSQTDPAGYNARCLHFAIEKYRQIYNVNFVLKKCLELGNYQAASKIALLENKLKQSMIYQLKGLQNAPKYHPKSLMSFERSEVARDGGRSPKSEIMTPESEIHLFADQGGKEEMCDDSNSQDISNSEDDARPDSQKDADACEEDARASALAPEDAYRNQLKAEYVDHAKYIIDAYLALSSTRSRSSRDPSAYAILETGIQFWTAEKLPVSELEDFLLRKLDAVYYDLGYLLFCQSKRENQAPVLRSFSSSFLLEIASRLVSHAEKNESCFEYLETMSKVIFSDGGGGGGGVGVGVVGVGVGDAKAARRKRSGRKAETFVQAITEKLKRVTCGDNFITVSAADVASEYSHYFSCGHWHSGKTLRDGLELFNRIGDAKLGDKLVKLYDAMDGSKTADVSCPTCAYNYIKQ